MRKKPNQVLTYFDDNVSFIKGPKINAFLPKATERASYFDIKKINSVISIKAETHNFPTTVEPFSGAATGSGGEIRDRMAGGRGSIPLVGTACYMTSYPRLKKQKRTTKPRPWLYQSPQEILTKASNGASDYGNKFGQPLINGSLFTFEHQEGDSFYGYDKTIMLAGGVGYALKRDVHKNVPKKGDKIILLGGDNYRIGMGGGAVSSVETGKIEESLELNAVQRSNPEMQKRAFNVIRALVERSKNPIILIHDHGAGGHINCLSELVEHTGGAFNLQAFPIGDFSLSDKEILGNESQERMGFVVQEKDVTLVQSIAKRENSPCYLIGEITGDEKLTFVNEDQNKPIDVDLGFLFSRSPKLTVKDKTRLKQYQDVDTQVEFKSALETVLQLEGVGCKDWLTNKVDRSVTGKVAQQQCVGPFQLPLHGAGVVALDFEGKKGIATAMGHHSLVGLIDAKKGTQLSLLEALMNLAFVPLEKGLSSVSLSANWMWPCHNQGEDARLYEAVQEASQVAMQLGINISTGKDSLSMSQNYSDSLSVQAPGTVVVSAVSSCSIQKIVTPDLKTHWDSEIIYINVSDQIQNYLGGSAFAQTQNKIGTTAPFVKNLKLFKKIFHWIQTALKKEIILAGQDVSSGGTITALLEMAFTGGIGLKLNAIKEKDLIEFLFCEKPAFLIQVNQKKASLVLKQLKELKVKAFSLGKPAVHKNLNIESTEINLPLQNLFKAWYSPSEALELFQTNKEQAIQRSQNITKFPLNYSFPYQFRGKRKKIVKSKRIKAAILREKGTNGEREMAYSLFLAGFDVKDITTHDLTEGKEDLSDIQFIVFCGGFSHSDVLGSARGWAATFRYQKKAKQVLQNFYQRSDTLSLGVCNGCQLMLLLGLVEKTPFKPKYKPMQQNLSGKFESSFTSVFIPKKQSSVMLKSLEGCRLGVWVAHKEGRFDFTSSLQQELIALKYSEDDYPVNPNGSIQSIAGISSANGRHLAMMPHLERAIFPWQWGMYEKNRQSHQVSPWYLAFVDAFGWLQKKNKKAKKKN